MALFGNGRVVIRVVCTLLRLAAPVASVARILTVTLAQTATRNMSAAEPLHGSECWNKEPRYAGRGFYLLFPSIARNASSHLALPLTSHHRGVALDVVPRGVGRNSWVLGGSSLSQDTAALVTKPEWHVQGCDINPRHKHSSGNGIGQMQEQWDD